MDSSAAAAPTARSVEAAAASTGRPLSSREAYCLSPQLGATLGLLKAGGAAKVNLLGGAPLAPPSTAGAVAVNTEKAGKTTGRMGVGRMEGRGCP
jgi:hypothetical protein